MNNKLLRSLASALALCALPAFAGTVKSASAGPLHTLTIDLSSLGLDSTTLHGVQSQCWTGAGFSAGDVTGKLAPLKIVSIDALSTSSITINVGNDSQAFSNVVCAVSGGSSGGGVDLSGVPANAVLKNNAGAVGAAANLSEVGGVPIVGPGESVLDPSVSAFVTPTTFLVTSSGDTAYSGLGIEADYIASGGGIGLWAVVVGSGTTQAMEGDLRVSGNGSAGTVLVLNPTVAANTAADYIIGLDIGSPTLAGSASLGTLEGIHIFHQDGAATNTGLRIDDVTTGTARAIRTALGLVEFGDAVQFDAANGSRPTCDSAHRFELWNIASGAGVKDSSQLCAKDAADAYAWRTIY